MVRNWAAEKRVTFKLDDVIQLVNKSLLPPKLKTENTGVIICELVRIGT
jgi:hypothetical protein